MKNIIKIETKDRFIRVGGVEYKIVLDSFNISQQTRQIAIRIANDFKNMELPLLLFVTNGGTYFGTAISTELDKLGFLHKVDNVCVSRYAGNNKTGVVKMRNKPKNVKGEHVIVIEDLIDKGVTLNFLHEYLTSKKAKSISYCVMVIKEEHEPLLFDVSYYILKKAGLGWLVGCGMDDDGTLRGLDYVCEKQLSHER